MWYEMVKANHQHLLLQVYRGEKRKCFGRSRKLVNSNKNMKPGFVGNLYFFGSATMSRKQHQPLQIQTEVADKLCEP